MSVDNNSLVTRQTWWILLLLEVGKLCFYRGIKPSYFVCAVKATLGKVNCLSDSLTGGSRALTFILIAFI